MMAGGRASRSAARTPASGWDAGERITTGTKVLPHIAAGKKAAAVSVEQAIHIADVGPDPACEVHSTQGTVAGPVTESLTLLMSFQLVPAKLSGCYHSSTFSSTRDARAGKITPARLIMEISRNSFMSCHSSSRQLFNLTLGFSRYLALRGSR
jgi:hypothetical protein